MFSKIIKYTRSIIRIIVLKIRLNNKVKLKIKNIKSLYIGKNVKINVAKGCILELKDNVYIEDNCRIECISGNIIIGQNTYFNINNSLAAMKGISIGNNCLFGPNVGIYDHDHCYDNTKVLIKDQGYVVENVDIKNNIWVGRDTTITKGVIIDDRVVVGCNSVVTKNLESNGLYAGIPAKHIKKI